MLISEDSNMRSVSKFGETVREMTHDVSLNSQILHPIVSAGYLQWACLYLQFCRLNKFPQINHFIYHSLFITMLITNVFYNLGSSDVFYNLIVNTQKQTHLAWYPKEIKAVCWFCF